MPKPTVHPAYEKLKKDLHRVEQRYRAARESSLDSFYLLEAVRDRVGNLIDFVFVDVNERGAKMVSMTPEQMIGKRLCELLPINQHGFFEKYMRVVETRVPLEEEFPIASPEFKASWLHHQIVPVDDGILITTRDISEQKKIEKQHDTMLRQSEKMFALGQLAAGVAHELNNPLSVILGFSDSLLGRIQPKDPLYDALFSIHRESLRCRTLVQNLLSFARNRDSDMSMETVEKIIDSVLPLIEAQAKISNIQIVKVPTSPELRLRCDGSQIQQVLINLCTNAMDAMTGGGTLTLEWKQTGQDAELWVTDTGIGIPQEIQDKVFVPFFTTKEAGKGTGLGLSLVYDIVQKHKGRIELDSAPGRGTTFRILLPASSE